MQPRISIIVPVYNAEKSLHLCVDSILSQTLNDYELLLINDGSEDSSGHICEEYAKKDSRIRVIHKPNGGASSARNIGLDNACGEWVTFCDADDYVLSNWLECFDLDINSGKDIICQGIIYERYEAGDEKVSFHKRISYDGNIADLVSALITNGIWGYTVNKAYRKDILTSENSIPIRFNPSLTFMEDEDFNYRYLMVCNNGVINTGAAYCYVLVDADKYDMYSVRRIPLYQYFINLSRKLCGGVRKDIEMKYHHIITSSFIFSCKKNHYKDIYMRNFRKYILKEFRCCPLFIATKLCIAIDPTGILSSAILRLHMKLKNHD